MFASADQDIGLDTDFSQLAHGVLCWFGLQFVGGLQIGHQREVHVEAVLAADVERELSNRFQERQALDVTDRATDFGDHHIDVIPAHPLDDRFNLVGDVRDDLDGLAEELSLTTAELSYLSERRGAYENLAKRTGVDGVKNVMMALIQAERYGTPVGTAIRTMADDTREQRMLFAEQKAASLPPKLTVPMILFFLPVLFFIIMSPAVMQVMELDSF